MGHDAAMVRAKLGPEREAVPLAARGKSRRWRSVLTGALVSVAIHIALLAAFVLSLKLASAPHELPATIVSFWPTLLPPLTKKPRRRVEPPLPTATPIPLQAAPIPPIAVPTQPLAPPSAPRFDLGAALKRSLGCADPDLYKLTTAERVACDQRGDEIQRDVRPLPLMIDRAKTDKWDAELARRRAPTGQAFTPCDGPGSNFGVGCPSQSGITVGRF